ncbi:hypothetical protein L7F22_027449, partial [Adiantum nelumboides]|nr:hypothetical protein [Adiantum nelumboides]
MAMYAPQLPSDGRPASGAGDGLQLIASKAFDAGPQNTDLLSTESRGPQLFLLLSETHSHTILSVVSAHKFMNEGDLLASVAAYVSQIVETGVVLLDESLSSLSSLSLEAYKVCAAHLLNYLLVRCFIELIGCWDIK